MAAKTFAAVENVPGLDMALLRRERLLTDGVAATVGWLIRPSGERGCVRVIGGRERIWLRWVPIASDELLEQPVDLVWRACRLGGERPFFRCSCGRHVLSVFLARGRWACRRCSQLLYRRQLSRGPAPSRKAATVRRRLGVEGFPGPDVPKPPRMRWSTYHRLLAAYRADEQAALLRLVGTTERILHRLQVPGFKPVTRHHGSTAHIGQGI